MYQNNKAFIFSDVHLRIEDLKLNSETGEYFLTSLEKIKEKIEELQPKYVFNLGDTFHNKDKVSSTLLILYHNFLKEITKNSIVVQIVGNHDFSIKKTNKTYHPFKIFNMENLVTVDDIYRFDDDIVFMAYSRDKETFEDRIQRLGNAKVLFGHLDINGFALGDDYIEKHSYLNPEDLDQFQSVFSGHYHEPQSKMVTKKLEIVYIGSVQTTTFGESDQDKRFILFDLEDHTYESIPTDMTYHKTLHITSNDKYPELDKEEVKKGIKYRIKVSGTKEEISVMKKPKNYPATVKFDFIPSKKTRLKIQKNDSKEEILVKYTEAEIERNYQGVENAPFDLEKLIKTGQKFLKRARG